MEFREDPKPLIPNLRPSNQERVRLLSHYSNPTTPDTKARPHTLNPKPTSARTCSPPQTLQPCILYTSSKEEFEAWSLLTTKPLTLSLKPQALRRPPFQETATGLRPRAQLIRCNRKATDKGKQRAEHSLRHSWIALYMFMGT